MVFSSVDWLRQRLRETASRAQALRVLLTLASLMATCALSGHPQAITPLFLGAIASALAETDDSARGRFRAQIVTLVCFAAAAAAVEDEEELEDEDEDSDMDADEEPEP